MELAERLKSQLASIGVKSQLDSDSEPDEPKAKSISKRSTTSAAPGVIEEKVKKSPTPRYYDYDKSNNATEEMISNWAKGSRSAVRTDKYKSESKRQGPASPVPPDFLNIKSSDYDEMDPYADYYGTSESPSEPTSNVVGTSQPDYHVSPVGDVDYRNGQKSTAYFSGSEDSNYSESSKPVDNNSHGDIDERHSRQHGKRKSSSTRKSADSSKKRSKRRRTSASGSSGNDSGSDSESESRRRRSDRSRPSDSSRVRSRTTKGSGSRGSYSPVPTSRASRGKFERGGRGFVPRVRERDSKDRPICRFYKEGYCREVSKNLISSAIITTINLIYIFLGNHLPI